MTRSYSSDNVIVLVNSAYITGKADGTFVSSEKDEDQFETYIGADGEVATAETHNNLGTITVTLEQTSPSNKFLMDIYNRKQTVPVYVIDSNGSGEKSGGSEARILKSPTRGFARGIETREYQFKVFNYKTE